MRAFVAACLVAIVVGVSAMAVLDLFVQKPVSTAFTTVETRI